MLSGFLGACHLSISNQPGRRVCFHSTGNNTRKAVELPYVKDGADKERAKIERAGIMKIDFIEAVKTRDTLVKRQATKLARQNQNPST